MDSLSIMREILPQWILVRDVAHFDSACSRIMRISFQKMMRGMKISSANKIPVASMDLLRWLTLRQPSPVNLKVCRSHDFLDKGMVLQMTRQLLIHFDTRRPSQDLEAWPIPNLEEIIFDSWRSDHSLQFLEGALASVFACEVYNCDIVELLLRLSTLCPALRTLFIAYDKPIEQAVCSDWRMWCMLERLHMAVGDLDLFINMLSIALKTAANLKFLKASCPAALEEFSVVREYHFDDEEALSLSAIEHLDLNVSRQRLMISVEKLVKRLPQLRYFRLRCNAKPSVTAANEATLELIFTECPKIQYICLDWLFIVDLCWDGERRFDSRNQDTSCLYRGLEKGNKAAAVMQSEGRELDVLYVLRRRAPDLHSLFVANATNTLLNWVYDHFPLLVNLQLCHVPATTAVTDIIIKYLRLTSRSPTGLSSAESEECAKLIQGLRECRGELTATLAYAESPSQPKRYLTMTLRSMRRLQLEAFWSYAFCVKEVCEISYEAEPIQPLKLLLKQFPAIGSLHVTVMSPLSRGEEAFRTGQLERKPFNAIKWITKSCKGLKRFTYNQQYAGDGIKDLPEVFAQCDDLQHVILDGVSEFTMETATAIAHSHMKGQLRCLEIIARGADTKAIQLILRCCPHLEYLVYRPVKFTLQPNYEEISNLVRWYGVNNAF